MDTKGDTLLTASARGDMSSGSRREAAPALLLDPEGIASAINLDPEALLVFTMMNTISYHYKA